MKSLIIIFLIIACFFAAENVKADGGYEIKGSSGVMHFVAIDVSMASNEDVYRLAVADACKGKAICQVHFWVGDAPSSFPISDKDVQSKQAHWQQNLNTGLRRWLVNCNSNSLFINERTCM